MPREWDSLETVAASKRVIDVWWEDSSTGQLMLLLAYLLTRSHEWSGARIRLLGPRDVVDSTEKHGKVLRDRIEEIRIDSEVFVTPDHDENTDRRHLRHRVRSYSCRSGSHGGRFYSPFGWEIGLAVARLPIVVLSLAAEDVDLEADPDLPAEPVEKPEADEEVATRSPDESRAPNG